MTVSRGDFSLRGFPASLLGSVDIQRFKLREADFFSPKVVF